jgi:hypothetical protein
VRLLHEIDSFGEPGGENRHSVSLTISSHSAMTRHICVRFCERRPNRLAGADRVPIPSLVS